MACTRQLFERGGHITTRICSSTSAAGSHSSKAIGQRLILRLDAPFVVLLAWTLRALLQVIFRVPAESPERILVRESLDQPRCVRGSTVHAAFRRLQLSNPPTLRKLGPRKCSEWYPNSSHQRSTETYYEFDC
jgi:hypothetical protein